MRWATALSRELRPEVALEALERQLRAGLEGARPDLLLLFVSGPPGDASELAARLRRRIEPRVLLGCTAAGVIGGGHEVESAPGVAALAGTLPGAELHPFHVDEERLPDMDAGPGAWVEALGVPSDAAGTGFLLLSEPGTFDPRGLLAGIDFAYPGAPVVGGLASHQPGNALFLGDEVLEQGAVGVALRGAVALDTLVAQGCRPIGSALTVTQCHRNLLLEVDHRRPLEVLAELYEALTPDDRRLLQTSLHLGVASSELRAPSASPDYLIRNVLGGDAEAGVLAVGSTLRPGQTVQFHLRDAGTAREELDLLLRRYRDALAGPPPGGAVLFSCTGRGRHLFGVPDHDSGAFTGALGEVPLAGFFCAGEIGPVGGTTYVHGYTSSFGLFRPRVVPTGASAS